VFWWIFFRENKKFIIRYSRNEVRYAYFRYESVLTGQILSRNTITSKGNFLIYLRFFRI